MSCITWSLNAWSSARCSGLSEAINRLSAAIRRAICSSSSSRVRGSPGNRSPYRALKSSKAGWVSSPRARASIRPFSSATMSRIRASCSGVAFLRPSAIERMWAPITCSRMSSSRSVEGLLRARVDEPVVPQLRDPPGRIARERVELRLAEPRVVIVPERQLGPFTLEDLIEPLPDLLERTREVQPGLFLVPALLEPPAQGVEPREPAMHPAAEQPAERVVRIAAHQHLVGELLEEIGRRDVGPERVL